MGDLDLALEAAFLATWYADYRQTMVTARNPQLYYERNPVLGPHPSTDRVRAYFAGGALVHTAISYSIPQGRYRTAWQAVTLGIEVSTVRANLLVGIKFY